MAHLVHRCCNSMILQVQNRLCVSQVSLCFDETVSTLSECYAVPRLLTTRFLLGSELALQEFDRFVLKR
jgi:hypothetical protein